MKEQALHIRKQVLVIVFQISLHEHQLIYYIFMDYCKKFKFKILKEKIKLKNNFHFKHFHKILTDGYYKIK